MSETFWIMEPMLILLLLLLVFISQSSWDQRQPSEWSGGRRHSWGRLRECGHSTVCSCRKWCLSAHWGPHCALWQGVTGHIRVLMIPGVFLTARQGVSTSGSHWPNTALHNCVYGRTQLATNLKHSAKVCLRQRFAFLFSVWLSYEPN